MNDQIEIPLLQDLIQVGETVAEPSGPLTEHDGESIEYELPNRSDAKFKTEKEDVEKPVAKTRDKDELEEVNSIHELLIDEEIRQILDRHMDEAYEEIIRLVNHRLSSVNRP